MKIPYTFSVLRYVHDVVGGEFANVVALYAPGARFLGAVCATTYGRLSRFFGGIDGPHVRRLLSHVQRGFEELADRLESELPLVPDPPDISGWIAQVLPPDDSSLQFGPPGGGLQAILMQPSRLCMNALSSAIHGQPYMPHDRTKTF